jgi:hypothetical protein
VVFDSRCCIQAAQPTPEHQCHMMMSGAAVRQLVAFQSRPVSRLRYSQLGVLARPLTRVPYSLRLSDGPETGAEVRIGFRPCGALRISAGLALTAPC